ncbi:hypothetical protein [Roseateles sp. L2-2]|uniref:hypothetical protein n=1 Tax=Roseateles sp. L2-2 TaxID=3422597 RepID=UPI003D36C7D7
MMKISALAIVALAAALGGCDRTERPASEPAPVSPTPVASSPAASTPDPAQAWLGRWNGPEGTYLQLDAAGEGRYEVRIKDLDAERKFEGVGKDGTVQFERDGKQESIKATNGDATGMKWLAGKSTCLTVHVGEGYCRD